ncbi:MAG: sigma 54-interacting transcriptional regulator [Peptococcaceae bacterium]|nr:sigma 54-interacting transcriptional regulator [Peptococcaceae bacterium]MDH7524986.1 sigma 54-interacting transcriptional regulator [Peptococcaceae bacterium]
MEEGVEPENLKPSILASWRRCRELGVNPLGGKNTVILSADQLFQILEQKRPLIDVVKPYMEKIYGFVKGSGFIIFLADAEAVILHVLGDREVLDDIRAAANFKVGADWKEKYVGTTSVGMALIEGKPIQIAGEEHYCLEHQRWTCSAVPIRNPSSDIVAVLGMAGSSEKVHCHTLGMLVAAGMAVENQLQVLETTDKLVVTMRHHRAVIDSVSEGILAVNNRGIITYMNDSAGKILLINPQEAIGKHPSEVLDFRPVILDVLESGVGYSDKEYIIHSKRGRMHFIKSAVPIRGEDGQIEGVVDIFREIKQVKRLVNQMVGAHARFTFSDIVGASKEIMEAKRLAMMAARSSSNVLITGESGTGKELFAQAIHNASSRSQGPFIAVNCGAIPRELIESEFFGYEEGAFTGARQGGRPGKFEMASGGSIFLDEIGEMPLDLQVRLLRVIQEREVTRVGGSKTIPVDVRVIAATNKDLAREMAERNFREDLFWRLNVINIYIPPLQQRGDDIELLACHFLEKLCRDHNVKYSIDRKTMELLKNYPWPGNVRELENALERAVNFAEDDVILPHHLPKNLLTKSRGTNRASRVLSLEQSERQAILEAIKYSRGNLSKTAQLLGIARNTLYSKIQKYGIECKTF